MFGSLIVATWVLLPAFVPNAAAVLFGGGRSLDCGRSWGGTRIFGDGKTWRGVVSGVLAGVMTAVLLNHTLPIANVLTMASVPPIPFDAAIAISSGAMVGDSLASFGKRRVGIPQGDAAPIVDQLDFVLGAACCTILVAPQWLFSLISPAMVGLIFLETIVIHHGANRLAYNLGLTKTPW